MTRLLFVAFVLTSITAGAASSPIKIGCLGVEVPENPGLRVNATFVSDQSGVRFIRLGSDNTTFNCSMNPAPRNTAMFDPSYTCTSDGKNSLKIQVPYSVWEGDARTTLFIENLNNGVMQADINCVSYGALGWD